MGIKQFTQEVQGIDDINKNLEKMNADSGKNFTVSLIAAIASVLALIVSIIAFFKG